ncbi:hypothetical protein CEE45_10475 [Candidatus Heimdallarchaeota archaeon B3_Heim]|nr:MAG: hypothetical protein CEE45_10475 [Candidatus Heimdallarchaeota archaeon B3_Heim]
MNFLKNIKPVIVSLTLFFVIILSCMPTTSVMSILLEESTQDETAGVDALRGVKVEVPKLMKRKTSQLSNFDDNSSSVTINGSNSLPKLAIGQQTGTGGGIFSIEDYLTLVGSDSVPVDDNHWQTNPEEHEDQYPLTIPANFVNSSMTLNISDVIAIDDWRLIENDSDTATDRTSSVFYEFAQEFVVEEDYVNVSSLRLFIDMDDTNGSDGQKPHGKLLLLNDTSGSPDDSDVLHSQALESHSSIAGLLDGNDWTGWLDYSIFPEVILSKGTYWFALNDTKDGGAGSWNWHTIDDSGQIDSGIVNYKFGHGDSWTPYSGRDIVMMPKVCVVENISSTYPAKEYTDPTALEFQYKTSIDTTNLNTFTMFEGNMTSDNIHSFNVNTSVNFTFSWWIEVNYTNNPITPSSYYKAMNNTDIAWNITFNHAQVSTSYQVRNHTLIVSGIPSDWNGTQIYWNDSLSPEYPDLTNDVDVTWDGDPAHKYTYGNTTMVVNTSTLAANTTWHVWFVAPNYLVSFNLSRGGQFLDLPYEANVTDTLGLNIQVLESGGNASYWIEDFNQQAIHKRTDFSSADFTDLWIIDDNVSQTMNVNGTYDLQAFWISSDKTKVGTRIRNLDVFINTTLTINSTDTIEVIIGEKITIWANYTSNHNSTINSPSHIDNAKIWCNASWPEGVKQNVSMNQPIGTYYNASFTTDNEDPGTSGIITITTQLASFVNWTKIIDVRFIGDSSLAVNEANIILKWRENTTLRVYYNDTVEDPIADATIIVDGDDAHPAVYDSGSGAYDYQLNSTQYSGVGTYLNLNITANHTDYQNQTLYFNLTINPAATSVDDASVDPADYPLDVTNGTAFYFWVTWISEYGDTLNDSDGIGSSSSDVVLDSTDPSLGNHTFKFVPTSIGSINVTLTFQISNYNAAIFHINVTSIESTSLTVNETTLVLTWRENTTLQIWYNDSANVPVSSASIIIDGDNAHPALYDPGSGAYYYQLNSTQYSGVGDYFNLNITAHRTYYQNQTLYFDLTIIPAGSSIDDASVNPVDYPLDITNGSVFSFWVTWFSEYGNPLNDSDGIGSSSSDVVLDSTNPTTGNHTFKFVPTTIGPINVTLTFQISNYNTAIYHINVTSIENTSLSANATTIVLNWRENTTLEIWYNNSFGSPIEDATLIVDGDTAHPAVFNYGTGTYYYQLNSTQYSGVGTYFNLNITANQTYYQNQTLYFDLTINPADSSINDSSVNPVDYPLDVTNGTAYYFWVIWFSEYGDPLNDSDGIGSSSSDVVLDSTNSVTGNHTFKFVPTTIGPINVTLTFQISNYNAAIFHINVTSIESTSLTVIETAIVLIWLENATLQIWYNDSSNTPINGATIIVDGDNIHPAIFNSSSGAYYYQLNSTQYNGVGSYLNLNITAYRTYYQNQTLYFDLTIDPADSSIDDASVDHGDYPLEITNGTAYYFWVIWFSEYGDPLNDSDGVESSSSDVVLDSTNPTTGNHTFKFVPTSIGPINVTLTFQISNYNAAFFNINITSIETTSLTVNETAIVLTWQGNTTLQIWYNNSRNKSIESAIISVNGDNQNVTYDSNSGAYYFQLNSTQYNGVGSYLNLVITANQTYHQNQTLYFNLTIIPADSSITDVSVDPVDYPLEITNGTAFYFWVTWLSEYGDPLNDSDGVGISSSDGILDSTNPTTGNHTFKFVPTTIGPINVTLTFQINNYNAAIFHINFTSIENTSLSANATTIVLTWRENTTLQIWYNNSANDPVPSAIIIINGDDTHPAVYDLGSGAYYYNLNSTQYSGVGTYLSLNITAYRTYYQNQTRYFDLTINPADSSVGDTSVDPLDYPLEITNGTAYYFWVTWFSEYGDPLNDSDGVESSSSDVVLDSTNPTTGNHTFKFVPTSNGPINVSLTFQISNYNAAIFHINVTSIESASLTVNETTIILTWQENTTLQIWYNDSRNNSIESALISVNGDGQNVSYDSNSGAYYYQLNSTQYNGVGDYLNLNITAYRTYYQNQTLYFDLTIKPADTSFDNASVDPVDYPIDVTNGSAYYFWVTWFSEYGDPLNDSDGVESSSPDVILDSTNPTTGNHTFKFVPTTIGPINVTLIFQISNYLTALFHINVTSIESTNLVVNETNIVLIWRENATLQIWYNDSAITPIPSATIIVGGDYAHPAVYDPGSGAYYYQLNSTQYSGVGTYLNLNITAYRSYYLNQTIYFDLTINPADSYIDTASIDPVDYPLDVTNGSAYYFWVTWFSEYGDPLNDSDGVESSSSDVVLDSTNPTTGNHTFKFVPTSNGLINVTLTFQINNYNTAIFHINVTSIESTSLTSNETSIVLNWRENATLQIWYNDSAITPIPSATIIIDGDYSHPAVYDPGSGAYYYQLNSTHYGGVGTYLNLNVTAYRTYYLNQTLYFDLIINQADSSIENTSLKSFPELNNVPSDENFEFWLIWQSEYNDFLNASDGVLINGTLNNHPDVYLFDTDASIGNHSFIFFYSGTAILTYNLTFIIENYLKLEFLIRFNVYNRTMMIDNGLSNPMSGQTIDFLQYGEYYYFSVFINDSSTKLPLNTTILDLPDGVIFLDYPTEGNHSFRYNASIIGNFSNSVIEFALQNYNTLQFNISFIVSPRNMILDSIRSTQQSIDYLQYGDVFYFLVYINDSRTGAPLNISTFSELPPNFFFENFSVTKGHLFWYQALERGDFIFEINFTKQNFNSYLHNLIFNITKANSELISSTTSITTYYSNDVDFSLVWQSIPNPNISSSPILRIMNTSSIIIQPSSPEWLNNIILHTLENGNYSFTVLSNRVGTVVITIIPYSDNYNTISIDIEINILLMPTFDPQISFQSELVVGESLLISCDQWKSITDVNVSIDNFQILNNSISIEYTPVDITEFSIAITLDTEDFRQGFHNLTLLVSSYGYENTSLSIFIEIIGREIEIAIEIFPENLNQGSDFTIRATLTYASLQRDLGGFGSGICLVPLKGVSVSFLVNIKYENGTVLPLEYNNYTNALGEAEFTVNRIYTISAVGIESITVTSGETASGKGSTQSTPPNFFDMHQFEKKTTEIPEELIILGIIVFLFVIIIGSPIGFYTIRKRKKGQKIVSDSKIKISPKHTPEDPSEKAPEVTPAIKEFDEAKVQPQIEDKVETEKRQTKPSPWIAQFPPSVSECEKEIRYLFILVLRREGQWHGRTSYNFLLKKRTDEISVANLRKVYTILPQQTSFFKKEKTSIIITEEGKRVALSILKNNDQ